MLGPRSEEKADLVSQYTRSVAGVSDAFANPMDDGLHVFSIAYLTGMPTTPRPTPFAWMRVQMRNWSALIISTASIMRQVLQIIGDDVLRSTAVTVGQRHKTLVYVGRSL